MKPVSRKWSLPFLLLATAGLVLLLRSTDREGPPPTCTFPGSVEMTSQEVISAWLEEQAQEAGKFFQEHQELFTQIKEAALAPKVTDIYQSFSISSGYSEPETLYLTHYRTPETGGVTLGYGAYPDGDYYRSISDLSPELEKTLTELLALRQPLDLSYTAQEDFFYAGALLQIGYSSTEFPTAIFCDVTFEYDPEHSPGGAYTLGDGWHIRPDYFYMYGL